MDLIDGASLKEHINSAKEKGLKFGEDRIWHIVVQVQDCLLNQKNLETK